MTNEQTKAVENAYKAAVDARKNAIKARTDYFESVLKDGETLAFKEKTLPEERHIGEITYWVVLDDKSRAVTLSKITDLEKVFDCIKAEKAFKLKATLLSETLAVSRRTNAKYIKRNFDYSFVDQSRFLLHYSRPLWAWASAFPICKPVVQRRQLYSVTGSHNC